MGSRFSFNTLIRTMGPGGGYYTVTGTIENGAVHGKLQRLGNNGRPQPSFDYDGVHKP